MASKKVSANRRNEAERLGLKRNGNPQSHCYVMRLGADLVEYGLLKR